MLHFTVAPVWLHIRCQCMLSLVAAMDGMKY
jgi:hypothetical protein